MRSRRRHAVPSSPPLHLPDALRLPLPSGLVRSPTSCRSEAAWSSRFRNGSPSDSSTPMKVDSESSCVLAALTDAVHCPLALLCLGGKALRLPILRRPDRAGGREVGLFSENTGRPTCSRSSESSAHNRVEAAMLASRKNLLRARRHRRAHDLATDRGWLRGSDSNRRPSGYEPDELPLLHPAPTVYLGLCLGPVSDRPARL
jgi:hypothetical protein